MSTGRSVSAKVEWDSTGEQLNPTAAGAALASITLGATGQYEARVTVSATAAAQFSVQHRNAGDTANIDDPCVVYVIANSSGQYLFEFSTNTASEVVRVKMDTDLTGTAAAHIQVRKVG